MCIFVIAEGQGHDLLTLIQTPPVIALPPWHSRLKATSKVDPFTLLFHPVPPALASPRKPLNESRSLHGCWKHHRWPQAPSDFNLTTLASLSHSPLVAWGLSHRKQRWRYSHLPPLPPPLHPLRWGMSSRCDSSQDVEQAPVSCLHLFPPVQISDRGFLEPGNWTAQLTDWQTGRKRGLAFAVSTSKFPSQSFLPQARQRRWLLNSNWSVLLWWLLLMQSLEMIMSINVSVRGQMNVIAWVEGWSKRQINS